MRSFTLGEEGKDKVLHLHLYIFNTSTCVARYEKMLQSMNRRTNDVLSKFQGDKAAQQGPLLSSTTKLEQFRKLSEARVERVKAKIEERYVASLAEISKRLAEEQAQRSVQRKAGMGRQASKEALEPTAGSATLDRYDEALYRKQTAILVLWIASLS